MLGFTESVRVSTCYREQGYEQRGNLSCEVRLSWQGKSQERRAKLEPAFGTCGATRDDGRAPVWPQHTCFNSKNHSAEKHKRNQFQHLPRQGGKLPENMEGSTLPEQSQSSQILSEAPLAQTHHRNPRWPEACLSQLPLHKLLRCCSSLLSLSGLSPLHSAFSGKTFVLSNVNTSLTSPAAS